ncbi:hypothetical protein FIBSPDRAFT_872627 [Athelia psychrophila]|uniref:Uncharacterized protein n=1 Tax=Athelia psychrophila TaxID=1759441 RepID=A0A165ZBQ8_9AGAM|nr:hypothetical protein FIBSPDRAFT_872627 [Fibularhizoctonia sp. CBS 109695]
MPVKAASSTGSVAPNTPSPDVHASSPPTGLEKGEKYSNIDYMFFASSTSTTVMSYDTCCQLPHTPLQVG